MNLALRPLRVIEFVDRRVLGAFRLVDAATGLPIITPAAVETRRVTVAGPAGDVVLSESAVRIQRNRSGVYVLMTAPFFDVRSNPVDGQPPAYTATFDSPQTPLEVAGGPLRVNLAVIEAGPQFLPRALQINLPRSLVRTAPDSVFEPQAVSLFRAPGAPVQDGWTVLRVRVTEALSDPVNPLPGVLVRAFRSPRTVGDAPIAAAMTDWRGRMRGEALLPVAGIQRFRPGSAGTVIVRDQEIEFDATRDTTFTGAAGEVPDVARLTAGAGSGLIRVSNQLPDPQLEIVRPVTPVRVQAGREYVVHLAMP
jgi:hypothetical protein